MKHLIIGVEVYRIIIKLWVGKNLLNSCNSIVEHSTLIGCRTNIYHEDKSRLWRGYVVVAMYNDELLE